MCGLQTFTPALQLMCRGTEAAVLIAQLRSRTSLSCDSMSCDRVFAREDENLSIEPVLLAQCVAHCVSGLCDSAKDSLKMNAPIDAHQAVSSLKQLLEQARGLPASSVAHCGGAMRLPARCSWCSLVSVSFNALLLDVVGQVRCCFSEHRPRSSRLLCRPVSTHCDLHCRY
jgi:hypothetical protein